MRRVILPDSAYRYGRRFNECFIFTPHYPYALCAYRRQFGLARTNYVQSIEFSASETWVGYLVLFLMLI